MVILRELAELFLIVSALQDYVRQSSKSNMSAHILPGVALGIGLGLLVAMGAAAFSSLDPRLSALITMAFSFSIVVVACGMFSSASGLRSGVQDALEGWLERGNARFVLLGFSAFIAFRETLEIALFIDAIAARQGIQEAAEGAWLGFGCAAVLFIGYRAIRASVDLRAAFRISALLLSMLAIQVLLQGFGELVQALVLLNGETPWVKATEPFLAGGEWYGWVCAGLMSIPAALMLRAWWTEVR